MTGEIELGIMQQTPPTGIVQAPSAAQRRELERLEEQNRRLRQVTMEILTLAVELRKGTIDRIMATTDFELGLQATLGTLPPGRS